jgi:antitoxin FitA-like protein
MSTKPKDEIVSAVLPPEVAAQLRRQARRNDRSISGEIRSLLKRWMKEVETEVEPGQ